MIDPALPAADVVHLLDLQPHPEGGWYRETWRAPSPPGGRASGTAIYYLLAAGDLSAWHRIDATEIWHFHAGGPLAMTLSPDGQSAETHHLGPDLAAGHRPQLIVPPGCWQTAESLGRWTLVSCTVSPGFEFSGFEMAPPDWRPTGSR